MQISEAPTADLELFAAGILEAKQGWLVDKHWLSQCMEGECATPPQSPLRAWQVSAMDSQVWAPRAFSSDPSAILMLMERMANVKIHRVSRFAVSHWVCIPDRNDEYVYSSSPTLGRAVLEAFCLANGWRG